MEELTRVSRLKAIQNRWTAEALGVRFPSLGVSFPEPATCADFVASGRFVTADSDVNLKHFGVEDPRATMLELGNQFTLAINGQVDPVVLTKAATILDVFLADSISLAERYAPGTPQRDDTLHESYLADAQATAKCQAIITALARELRMPLPVKEGQ